MKSVKYTQGITSFIIIFIFLINSSIYTNSQPQFLSDDSIDQEQSNFKQFLSFYDSTVLIQSFQPTVSMHTQVDLYLKKIGSISSPITLSILESLSGPLVMSQEISSDQISTSGSWVSFPIDNESLSPYRPYFIRLSTNEGSSSNYYQWGHNINNSYLLGSAYLSNNNGSTWNQLPTFDFAFKTYAHPGDAEGELEILYFVGKTGGQIEYGLKNTGNIDITDLEILVNFIGGFKIGPKEYDYEIETLGPGKEIHNIIYPVIGIGPTALQISISSDRINDISETYKAIMLFFYVYIQ